MEYNSLVKANEMGFPGGDDVISDTCGSDDVYLEFSDGITCGFFNEVD